MENAHLRLGLLEYVRIHGKGFDPHSPAGRSLYRGRSAGASSQRLRQRFGCGRDHGSRSREGRFSLTFPDGETKDVSLGEHASCYKGAVTLPGRKHPVRHLLAVSQELHTNGSAGRTILLRYRREEAWATLVSFLGLPADPTWADHILRNRRAEEADRGDRRHRLPASTDLRDDRGDA